MQSQSEKFGIANYKLSKFADLIEEFMVVLYKHDIAKLKSVDVNEYESEALSILARFVEGKFYDPEIDETVKIPAACGIISKAFEFWFEDDAQFLSTVDYVPVARELIEVFQSKLIDEDNENFNDQIDIPDDMPEDIKDLFRTHLQKITQQDVQKIHNENYVEREEVNEIDLQTPVIQIKEKK